MRTVGNSKRSMVAKVVRPSSRRVRQIAILAMIGAFLSVGPPESHAKDVMKRAMSPALHLGVEGAFGISGPYDGQSAFSGQAFFSLPLSGVVRGLHFEIGAATVVDSAGFQLDVPIGLRYTFLFSSGFAPYVTLGTGYYISTFGDVTDHGFSFLHAGAGVEYFFTNRFSLGIGFDFHGLPLSMSDEKDFSGRGGSSRARGSNWLGYGLKTTIVF